MGGYNRDNRSGGRFRGKSDFDGRGFGGRQGGFNKGGGRPMMHQAVCNKCGNDCEVPFRPSENRPVFCNNCFERPAGDRGGDRSSKNKFSQPSFVNKTMFDAVCHKCGEACAVPFQPRHGKAVLCDKCFGKNRDSDRGSNKDNSASIAKKLDLLAGKLDLILEALAPNTSKKTITADSEAKPEVKNKPDKEKKVLKNKIAVQKIKKTVKKKPKSK